jgi:hypothetical protein
VLFPPSPKSLSRNASSGRRGPKAVYSDIWNEREGVQAVREGRVALGKVAWHVAREVLEERVLAGSIT